ncbi:MAG TPA: PQQ-dependent dehydrogenase, methanol/ethanol family, partial [Blastocatellia bacterium]|nr:PQQ-dependent dehydrogenase, methanol/ethanol family [Blastocatellia bacterium]
MKKTILILVVILACFCTFVSRGELAQTAKDSASSIDDSSLRNADSRTGDWIIHGRNYAETRFSPLSKISAENVKDLGLAWSFETKTTRGLEATP